jgi:RNA polymerase sigma factor (sigma-70 family)
MSDVTRALSALESGDPAAAEQLMPLVYDELRKLAAAKLAHEKPGQTLQATALVHEAYLRLVGNQEPGTRDQEPAGPDEHLAAGSRPPATGHWNSRGHFFAAAAEAMRRILVDRARRKARSKHGAEFERCDIEDVDIEAPSRPDQILAIHDALTKLESTNEKAAQLVKLRYFAGLTIREAAEALGVSSRKADQIWAYARVWLLAEIGADAP